MEQQAKTDIKSLLRENFGIFVNISEGIGLRDDPFVVLDKNPIDALATELQVLRGVGMGRRAAWRVSEKVSFCESARIVDKLTLEIRWPGEDKAEVATVSYYFDISASGLSIEHSNFIAYKEPKSKLALPFSLGWLHFNNVSDHEAKQPGSGCGIGYGTYGVKCNLFVYDKCLDRISSSPTDLDIQYEFEYARRDISEYYASVKPICSPAVVANFIETKLLVDDELSYLGVGAIANKFVKYRITCFAHPFHDRIANESKQYLMHLIEHHRAKSLH